MKAENSRISELILKAKSGDKAAFEELYKITSPKAYFVALKICKNEHDAEDILQESYIKVLEKIDTVDPEGNFTAWLYQIVANKSKNFMKAKKPVLFGEEEEEIIGSLPDEDLSFTPEEKVDKEELRSEVMAAVDELTAEKRACVMMMYFGDMSVNEIAQSLEVPVSTVKNRLFTARKDLKNKFEKKGITALYSAAPLGVVIWALGKTGETTAAAFAASTASAAVLAGVSTTAVSTAASTATATTAAASTAAATSSTAAATGTGIAAKVAALSVAQKVVAGVAAVGVIGGSTAGVATVAKKVVSSKETTSYVEEVTTAPSQSEEYVFAVIPTEETTTAESTTDVTEPSATKRKEETTTRNSASSTSVTVKETASSKQTTTNKQTTTRRTTTTKPTTTKATTTRPTTTESTTEEETTTQPTTTQPATTEPTTQAPATVAVEVIDMNEDVVDSFTLTVPADTEMTWEYLVSQIKAKGHEPKAGIYGDAVGAVAEAGGAYSITAEL
ncbi:MAG: RNA polymerase sigma factor [Clostridia bacterium]|nr:RNA polymerase sigma factor [Clostridia bacterium]